MDALITIDSELISLLKNWYFIDQSSRNNISKLLLNDERDSKTFEIKNKIHFSQRSEEVKFLIFKLIIREDYDLMPLQNSISKLFDPYSQLFSDVVSENITDEDIEHIKLFYSKRKDYYYRSQFLQTMLLIPNSFLKEFCNEKLAEVVAQPDMPDMLKRTMVFDLLKNKTIPLSKAALAISTIKDKNVHKNFLLKFPEAQKYFVLI